MNYAKPVHCILPGIHTTLLSCVQDALQVPSWIKEGETAALAFSVQSGACVRTCKLRQTLAALQKRLHLQTTGSAPVHGEIFCSCIQSTFSSQGAAILRLT